MRFVKTIFIIAILSILIFAFCTLLSYLLSKETNSNFKIGWPYEFYYQFKIRGETGYGIQHGSWLMNLIYNCILSFVFAILIFFGYKKIKRNNIKIST